MGDLTLGGSFSRNGKGLMAKFCACGSLTCPICNPRQAKAKRPPRSNVTPNVRRNEPETENVRRTESLSEEELGKKLVQAVRGGGHSCPTCGRPYCPECGDPIPVRGEYCKAACRSRAWRKRKVDNAADTDK
jgi:hypothetical protein